MGSVAILAGAGYLRCAPERPSAVAESLRSQFPTLASRALRPNDAAFGSSADDFIASNQSGALHLPRFTNGPARWSLPDGFEIQITEEGLSGAGGAVEGSIAYPRSNGHVFWSRAPGGFEEWLLAWKGADAPVARWDVAGAVLKQNGALVELVDESGAPRASVSVPEAYASGGQSVKARLTVEGTTLSLSVDAASGWILVDPLWTLTAGPLTTDRQYHTGTTLVGGVQVLVVGGEHAGGATLASAELYSVGTSQSAATNSLAVPRKWHTATLLADGRVLVVGGFNGAAVAGSEVFDPVAQSWVDAGTLNVARWFHTATLLPDGTVLVAGGFDGGVAVNVAEIWNPANETWTTVAGPMTAGRYRHTATAMPDGGVLLAGGANSVGASLQSAEIYSGTFGATPNMNATHAAHTATALQSGRVLVVGDQNPSTAAEVFTPSTGAWTSVGPMANARGEHAAATLASGAVVVSGGSQSPGIGNSEVFNPTSTTWSNAGCLVVPRFRHSASALSNGTILIAGGFDGGVSLAATEVYDPDGGAQGTGCTAGCECQSGFCANGVCCDSACNGGSCEACSVAAGATTDGTCAVLPSTKVCRASAGACDVAEFCPGDDAGCPGNSFLPSTTLCRGDAGTCDFAAFCTGTAPTCPGNSLVPAQTTCRPDAGACDISESCTGSSAQCPADKFLPSGSQGVPPCGGLVCLGTAICPTTCQNDSQCPSNGFCNAGTCESTRGNGASCGAADFCQSGHCVSGVCCNNACTGACEACLVSAGGPADGTCGDVTAGTDGSPSCGGYVCDGTSASCPTTCTADSQCAATDTCVNKACVPKADGGLPLGYSGWHCGCQGGAGDTAFGALALVLFALTGKRSRRSRSRTLATLAVLLAVGASTAFASSTADDAPIRTVVGLDDITGSSRYRDPDELAWLHLSATGFYEFNAHNAGAEVGVSVSPIQYADFGLAAVLGQYIGGRVTATVHPGSDWTVRPFVQLRGLVHPVPGALALGGGAQAGLSLAIGPGHLSAGAAGELYKGPPQFESQALFAMLGYEIDLLHSSSRDSTPAPTPFVTDTAPVPEEKPAAKPPPPRPAKSELPMPPPPPTRGGPPATAAPSASPEAPTEGAARVSVRIVIRDRIEFELNKVRLRPKYLPVIKKVAGILKRFPHIKKLALEGHADDPGTDAANQKLSNRRALAVMEALMNEGVDPSRLDPRANGRTQPLVQRGTKKAREVNRRVEFNIVDPADQAP